MSGTATLERPTPSAAAGTNHVDVLIVGAGISGVGSAYHLLTQTPGTSFVILEAMESFGGTWWMHKYPGVRSDSDLYTFGYRFKPWTGAPIASRDEILKYMDEVIEENGIGAYIRYQHRITKASWSTADKRWTIEAIDLARGETKIFTANFLWMCQGYYRHAEGYTPEWPGMKDFKGQIVHPQTWPDDIDLKGKKVICIGSGATAATVVPAIAHEVDHVTVVQRSPTYFIPGRNANELADTLRQLKIDDAWIHEIVRRKLLFDQEMITQRCKQDPEGVKTELLEGVRAFLGPDYPIDPHFTPRYRPWQQRIAFVPDGDLFQGIAAGKASMETSAIECFTPKGLKLSNGKEIEADVIITATGFNLSILGDINFHIDGKPLDFAKTVTYRGMMFTGIPNMIWVFGYFRASWTLRVDLLGDFVCRLLKHMKANGKQVVEVVVPPEDQDMTLNDWMDPTNFNPNYLMRSNHLLPRRGSKYEWQHTQDYWREKDEIPAIDITRPMFKYS